jgi:hypothetical protein
VNQIFVASTFFGAMNLAAAIDEGHFGSRSDHLRTLLVTTNSWIPESTTPWSELPGALPLLERYDQVADWNAVVAPFHPSTFTNFGEPTVTSRWLASTMRLADEPIQLVVESIHVPPARTLANIMVDASVTVYSDGLMSYGPTRSRLPSSLGERVERLLYLDLIPGLRPVLLSEFAVPSTPLGDEHFAAVVKEVAAADSEYTDVAAQLPQNGRSALVLGQYLPMLGLLSAAEDAQLFAGAIDQLADAGFEHVVFKPHPTSAWSDHRTLSDAAAERGARLTVIAAGSTIESVLTTWSPDLVVGCFSTALLVANHFFDLPVAAFGTGELLATLRPYENSNRVPLTIIYAIVPPLDSAAPRAIGQPRLDVAGGTDALEGLVHAVAYTMQPGIYPEYRASAELLLQGADSSVRDRYFEPARLHGLGLSDTLSMWRLRELLWTGIDRLSRKAGRTPRVSRLARATRRLMRQPVRALARWSPRLKQLIRSLQRG